MTLHMEVKSMNHHLFKHQSVGRAVHRDSRIYVSRAFLVTVILFQYQQEFKKKIPALKNLQVHLQNISGQVRY